MTKLGSKFSSSRNKVIYVRDFLAEFGPDALRYYIAVAGPENQDTDFTWDEFVRRTNFELANEWGNLVNRSISMAHKNNGAIPAAGDLTEAQVDALRCIANGDRHTAAAERLGISESALKARISGARVKLGARTTAEAIQRAKDFRLL